MALFDAHPALDTVRIDQVSRYIDECVAVRHRRDLGQRSVRPCWKQHRGWIRRRIEPVDLHLRLVRRRPLVSDRRDRRVRLPERGPGPESTGAARRRPPVGPGRCLGTCTTSRTPSVMRSGRWWSGSARTFSGTCSAPPPPSTSTATRSASRTRSTTTRPTRPARRRRTWSWVRDRLGHVTEAYLTSPERAGSAGLRVAYTGEIVQLERLPPPTSRLRSEAESLRHQLPTFWAPTIEMFYGRIRAWPSTERRGQSGTAGTSPRAGRA